LKTGIAPRTGQVSIIRRPLRLRFGVDQRFFGPVIEGQPQVVAVAKIYLLDAALMHKRNNNGMHLFFGGVTIAIVGLTHAM
jgi:hypothetical protein